MKIFRDESNFTFSKKSFKKKKLEKKFNIIHIVVQKKSEKPLIGRPNEEQLKFKKLNLTYVKSSYLDSYNFCMKNLVMKNKQWCYKSF